jgi:hypothetical protein
VIAHVAIPLHMKTEFVHSISGFHDEPFREDVRQFGPITIATTRHFFLIVIVVTSSQQMTENEFWDIYIVFFVDDHWDALAIVVYRDESLLKIDLDIKSIHARVLSIVVRSVYENLIENLEHSWSDGDLLVYKVLAIRIQDPQRLNGWFY